MTRRGWPHARKGVISNEVAVLVRLRTQFPQIWLSGKIMEEWGQMDNMGLMAQFGVE